MLSPDGEILSWNAGSERMTGATRQDVVGLALSRDLESLQDRMPPFPQAEAEATIVAAFDKPLNTVFNSFGPPVAAASTAPAKRRRTSRCRHRKLAC